MRFFLDSEFAIVPTDDPPPRQPGSPGRDKRVISISLAVVRDDGAEGYWVFSDHDEAEAKNANPWLVENVYVYLPPREEWVSREQAARGVLELFDGDPDPELWAYWNGGQIDLFVMRQLFDEPPPFMGESHNLRAWMKRLGLAKEECPPEPERNHEALADARWDKEMYDFLAARSA